MKRMMIYLTDDLQAQLDRAAQLSGKSKADLIRQGVRDVVAGMQPRPRIPLFSPGRGDLADRVDDLLDGFGKE